MIDDEHRGILRERHPPPSGKCQGMLADQTGYSEVKVSCGLVSTNALVLTDLATFRVVGKPETEPKRFPFAQMGFRYRERLRGRPLACVNTVRRVFGTSAGPMTHGAKK